MSAIHLTTPSALPVQRDEHGFWTHPSWPDDGDECAIPKSWFTEQGLELAVIEFEYDAPEPMADAYYENGDTEQCANWEPSQPEGAGWFIFSIHDTDDGPVCVWVRKVARDE